MLIEGGRVAWVGRGRARPRRRALSCPTLRGIRATRRRELEVGQLDEAADVVDAGGACVIPGFVDRHTHLVFGGDRAAEFEARMAGRRYEAGGIRSTVAATRAATDEELRTRLAGFVAEMLAQGTTTFEIKSGYGLTSADEERLVRLAAEVTAGGHLPRRARRAGRVRRTTATTTSTSSSATMLEACAPHARWIDVFCETGAFTLEESRRILEAGIAAGLQPRVHASQLGPGDGVRLAVELGAASVDHCTYLSDEDVAALARLRAPSPRCCRASSSRPASRTRTRAA